MTDTENLHMKPLLQHSGMRKMRGKHAKPLLDHLILPLLFKVGLCQLSVSPDKNQNVICAHNLIKVAAEQGARLVVLPEMGNCPYSAQSADNFAKFAEDFGDILFKESDSFAAGDEPTILDTEIGRIGIGICHDIRFPELATLYRAKGAHLICCPGAFNMSTGELLWDLCSGIHFIEQAARKQHCFDMYAKLKFVLDAQRVFDAMEEKDIVACTAMICRYTNKVGLMEQARCLFNAMEESNVVSWTAMIAGYANYGYMESAKELYDRMVEKNSVALARPAMIAGYG
ncbi:hypothetical protein CCACVL1_08651 [Corchorus capsularis]|uniref:CN hydrolase domain-containing protein n=1 Tax=Corchorus capsularis TaxID=210143 RepID=A0A1R3IZC0_COCAP|nr:hypothetical protein CCACVL1_08651 [Corchorus capsularis]